MSTTSKMKEFDVTATLEALSLQEQVALLAGLDFWHTVPIPRLGIPSVRLSDGPNGVRGIKAFNGTSASCFPCATAMAASWDEALQNTVAKAIGEDCRAKGVHILLGPTMNIQRSPLGGRGFESFSEDPYLSGRMAIQYVRGLQEKGVAATIKHFVCNDQEDKRFSTNVLVSERALHEIYLRPFELCLRDANPWALMAGYNAVNGVANSENKHLLQDVLRKRWQYQGLVMSDYFGVYSTAASIKAGLNVEMPGATVMRGAALMRAYTCGRVSKDDIAANARKVIEMVNIAVRSEIEFMKEPESVNTPEMVEILRRAATETIVLLKNAHTLLPFKQAGKIAVIGPNARTHVISGGGSAALHPTHTVSVFDAVREAIGTDGEVTYAPGCTSTKLIPLLQLGNQSSVASTSHGLLIEFFNDDPWAATVEVAPVYTTTCAESKFILIDNVPDIVNQRCWIRVSAKFTCDKSGKWEFGLLVAAGQGDLYLDDKMIVDNSTNQIAGEEFAMAGTVEERGCIDLVANTDHDLEVRFTNERPVPNTIIPMGRGALRLGARLIESDEDQMDSAVTLAQMSDAAILVVGLNDEWEAEGFDRVDMKLPYRTDDLVARICKAQPNTVVVVQSGTPVEMPWADQAPAIMQAWYGGNEFGNGVSDVIFGKANPAGRLSLSYPLKLEHNPTYNCWGDEGGESRYGEGLFVGYRHYDSTEQDVLFPFGHGLSYNSSSISELQVVRQPLDRSAHCPEHLQSVISVNFTVENTTATPGKEVLQVYVGAQSPSLRRPKRELKAFTKIDIASEETKSVSISLTLEAFAFWDPVQHLWQAEKGIYTIYVGLSSRDLKSQRDVEIYETARWE